VHICMCWVRSLSSEYWSVLYFILIMIFEIAPPKAFYCLVFGEPTNSRDPNLLDLRGEEEEEEICRFSGVYTDIYCQGEVNFFLFPAHASVRKLDHDSLDGVEHLVIYRSQSQGDFSLSLLHHKNPARVFNLIVPFFFHIMNQYQKSWWFIGE